MKTISGIVSFNGDGDARVTPLRNAMFRSPTMPPLPPLKHSE